MKLCGYFIILYFILVFKYLSSNTGSLVNFFLLIFLISLRILLYCTNIFLFLPKNTWSQHHQKFLVLRYLLNFGNKTYNILSSLFLQTIRYLKLFFEQGNLSHITMLSIFTSLTSIGLLEECNLRFSNSMSPNLRNFWPSIFTPGKNIFF